MNSMIARTEYDRILEAYVCFSGQTDLPWLRVLKPGFRHCYIVAFDGQRWFSVDFLSNHTDIKIYHHLDGNYDFPRFMMENGIKFVPAPMHPVKDKPAPMGLATCVNAVKRFLRIHNRFILTPYQLYKYLLKINGLRENKV